MPEEYEEYQRLGQFTSWVIIVLFTLLIVVWGLLAHFSVHSHTRRHWDFGALPDTPGESIYSTNEAQGGLKVPLQFPPLPGSSTPEEFRRTNVPPANLPEGANE